VGVGVGVGVYAAPAWHCALLQSNGCAAAAAHCAGGLCAGAPGIQFHAPSAVACAHPGRETMKLLV
jgi:hypothetical protein